MSIVNECCCGYVKGIALDPLGWRPLIEAIEARSDWFEVIHLYGTKSGWDRLKELVAAHEDVAARYQALIDLTAPAARNIDAYWLARRAPAGETIHDSRQPIHKMPAPGRNDPCPCDSGKKFKHSHGEPETLHQAAVSGRFALLPVFRLRRFSNLVVQVDELLRDCGLPVLAQAQEAWATVSLPAVSIFGPSRGVAARMSQHQRSSSAATFAASSLNVLTRWRHQARRSWSDARKRWRYFAKSQSRATAR